MTKTINKKKDTVQKSPNNPPTHSSISITAKQKEVMVLLSKNNNLTQIHRKLNINKSSAADRLKGLVKKKLVLHKDYSYTLTKLGKYYLNECTGTNSVLEQKNIHHNEFTVDIKRLPNQWYSGHWYFQSLKAKDILRNKTARQVFIEFEDCKIRISETKLKATFWIKKQYGKTFEQIQSKVWDLFVKYYNMLKFHGFSFNNQISSPNQHFADPNGFFAKLSSSSTNKGFRIDSDEGSFWVDYSDGKAEDETTDEEKAERMEQLANSAFSSESDFNDLDKVVEISRNLVKIHTLQLRQPLQQTDQPQTIPKYIG